MSKLVFCLMGPTASGKTDLACELVQHAPVEVISVDSAMIYRGMNIGTAKPDQSTLAKAPHHLLDILDPPESYSAARFCEDADKYCQSIHSRGKFPLLVGGTMMYFKAFQDGLAILPPADEQIRKKIIQQAQAYGWQKLHQQLMAIDPLGAANIHPHDTQRIQRALEVYALTTKPASAFLRHNRVLGDYQFINLILMPKERQWLHQRIATRFEQMLKVGLIEEVEQLVKQWDLTDSCPAMRCVGYRQVLAYLQEKSDYADLMLKGIAVTRQLAKRQLTWLRHWQNGLFYDAESPAVLSDIMAIVFESLGNLRL